MSDKEKSGDLPQDGSKKRGPSDCLEDSDEEEFTPFTQSNPELVFRPSKKKIFARKSSSKRPLARGKKVARSSCSSGNYLFFIWVCIEREGEIKSLNLDLLLLLFNISFYPFLTCF